MIKPDGVHRGLVADVIKRFEARGYKLVGIKVNNPQTLPCDPRPASSLISVRTYS